ncbi:MAG TPA: sugar phosphate isomerase/epimerase [Chryseosolibacter sp.]|nr:sugar phosphate isomerase/epimerase [Chryseosolibacter sp.]
MNRRNFIIRSSALVPGGLMARMGFWPRKKYKMGLQLFTVRDAMRADVTGTLKTIASLGYEDLETYGYDPIQKKYYGLPGNAFRNLLIDNQLSTSSGHYDFHLYFDKSEDALKRYVDQCIEGAHAVGQHYITWPWLDPQSRTLEKFKALAAKLNVVGEQINKSGLGFAYHNHDYEFTDQNGTNGYEIIMDETDAKFVKLQLDLYWVMHSSKLSPQELISKQPGRFVMWHVKDMDKVTRDYTELGNGSIDYTAILPEASRAGLQYYFIEQGGNFAVNSIKSITDSAAFFKQNLERYLG